MAKSGLTIDEQPVECRRGTRVTAVSFRGAEHVSVALKHYDYREVYRRLRSSRAYTAVMLDNALVQMMYRFRGMRLAGHRLAFFPAPELHEFQNQPELYRHDEPFSDVVARTTAPMLIRFDYDADHGRHRPIDHPKSHLTLGRYDGCRIPVSAPLTPHRFMDFLLRNFYDTEDRSYSSGLSPGGNPFEETIDQSERQVMHMSVPS